MGPQGPAGEGLEADLVRINALSWRHNTHGNKIAQILDGDTGQQIGVGFVIGFTREVDANTVDAGHVFQILIRENEDAGDRSGRICRCPIAGRVVPVKPDILAADPNFIVSATTVPGPDARGVAFIPDEGTAVGFPVARGDIDELWVKLRCDFVVDYTPERRAVDGEFVRGELPTGDRPRGSKNGVQGGLFESWFWQRGEQNIDPKSGDAAGLRAADSPTRGGTAEAKGETARAPRTRTSTTRK